MIRYPPNPCRDCQDRHVGCHSDCDRHLEWQMQKDREKQKLSDATQADNLLYRYNKESKNRAIQRANNRHRVGVSLNDMSKSTASGVIDPNLDSESYS